MTPRLTQRQPVFRAIALALPLLVLGLIEMAVRASGFAAPEPLFVPSERPGYRVPNEQVINRYFGHPAFAPRVSIDTTYVPIDKPANALRIVVQGGSTAAGFPYGKWVSPAGLLKHRIQRTLPGQPVEVITTAMSAVNSYTLTDFADEIVALEPDMIVIYAGHNEYLGVLGVGSAFGNRSLSGTRAVLALRKLRTYRALERIIAGIRKPTEQPSGTLMARIAREREIPYDSPLYNDGIEQFRANMGALLTRYETAGIPVFMGTLVMNERDQAPFMSADDTDSAAAWFEKAVALEANGEYASARDAYRAAADRDRLRFRAPQAINDQIRDLAGKHGARLVDVQQRFAAESDNGIVGSKLMLEHLHPNVDGYFLIADAFYDAILETIPDQAAPAAVPDDVARADMPVTELDRIAGSYRAARLVNDWPFVDEKIPYSPPAAANNIERISQDWFNKKVTWAQAMQAALTVYQHEENWLEAARVARNIADAFAFEHPAKFATGQLLYRAGDSNQALWYMERAIEMAPREPRYLLTYAQVLYESGRTGDSKNALRTVLRIDPGNVPAKTYLEKLEKE